MLPNSIDEIHSIQLETTSRCNLNCITCLKPAYCDVWQERDMDDVLFRRVLTQLPAKPNVHLQGWGEPLMHPETFSHIAQLKAKGAAVSFTTNGTMMDSAMAVALIESGLDALTFSMAGNSQLSQGRLRGAGSFDRLHTSIGIFNAARKKYNGPSPKVAVSYLLTPETVGELPGAVAWCRSNGVDAFVAVHLTQAACRNQEKLQFLLSKEQSRPYRLLRIQANMRSVLSKMRVDLGQFHSALTPVCGKNAINNLFISAAGDVSPCVFLCPPLSGELAWRYKGAERRQKPLVFGNVRDNTLAKIWKNPEYVHFRERFEARKKYHDKRLSGIGCSFAGSEALDEAVAKISDYFSTHPPPQACSYCAKIDGF